MQLPSYPQPGTRPEALRALHALGASEPLRVRVAGSCMAPSLSDGQLVTVRPGKRYWPGDVVAFLAATPEEAGAPDGPGRLTMHRVIGWGPRRLARPWRDWGVWTQADHAALPDRPIAGDRILGRVDLPGGPTLAAAVRAWARFLVRPVRRLADRFQLASGARRA